MNRGAWRATVHGVANESDTTERLNNNHQSTRCSPELIAGGLALSSGSAGVRLGPNKGFSRDFSTEMCTELIKTG